MKTPNRNNARLWKWVSGILGVLLTASIIGAITTLRQIQDLQTTQILMGRQVLENSQWIKDWSTVLRVPERDQRQDSDIEELKRRMLMLEQEMRER